MKSLSKVIAAAVFGVALTGQAAASEPHVAPMTKFANDEVKQWIADPVVVEAVKAQNEKHASLSQDEIDALDKQWRAETSSADRPMIDKILSNALSGYLAGVKEQSGGLVTEVFVMDNKGLNVGQSDPTSDFWQGDEAKWQKTYLEGPDSIFVDEIEEDESTQTFQSQVSLPVVDPATGELIGAITVGVDVEGLL